MPPLWARVGAARRRPPEGVSERDLQVPVLVPSQAGYAIGRRVLGLPRDLRPKVQSPSSEASSSPRSSAWSIHHNEQSSAELIVNRTLKMGSPTRA